MVNFVKTIKNNFKLLILLLILTSISVIYNWDIFSKPTDINKYEQLYSNSQYVLGEKSLHKIDDSEVYIYAGYTYVRGDDPTAVNFEHTPLVKYFFGLSYLITGNSLILNIPLYFFTLLLIYLLASKVIKNKLIIYGILIIVGTMKLYYLNVGQGLLDLPNLFASLLFFNTLFTKFKNNILKYILLGVILGMFAGTRYPFPLILLLIVPMLFWAFFKKELKQTLLSFLFLAITYLATYSVYFKYHPISEFPKFEWYRFKWFAGDRSQPKHLIFQTIFIGKFKQWWANGWTDVSTYTIVWPILFTASILGSIKNKINLKNTVLLMYTFGLITFYSVAAATYDRFLIEIIPFWGILAGIGIDNLNSETNIFVDFIKIIKTKKLPKDFKN